MFVNFNGTYMSSWNNYTDEQLLSLLKDSKLHAFNAIYFRYWKLLFSLAVKKLHNFSDAEEVVQDIFTDLWNRREDICITYSLKAYLSGAVKFQVYTIMARKYRQQAHVTISATALDMAVDPHCDGWYDLKQLESCIEKAAGQLPRRCELVYRLSREAGYSNKQIAQKLQISEKTVENQMTRALKQLRLVIQGLVSLF